MSPEQLSWGVRFTRALRQFIKFGLVGGSGTLVNLAVAALSKKIAGWTAGIHENDAFLNLLGTSFHIRWYHVFMTIAFLVANTWNYQLNRMWTFRSREMASWWRGFFPFLATGLVAFVVSQVVATLLMNPTSPIALSSEIFDDSSGLRTSGPGQLSGFQLLCRVVLSSTTERFRTASTAPVVELRRKTRPERPARVAALTGVPSTSTLVPAVT